LLSSSSSLTSVLLGARYSLSWRGTTLGRRLQQAPASASEHIEKTSETERETGIGIRTDIVLLIDERRTTTTETGGASVIGETETVDIHLHGGRGAEKDAVTGIETEIQTESGVDGGMIEIEQTETRTGGREVLKLLPVDVLCLRLLQLRLGQFHMRRRRHQQQQQ
jgi:hypothetical protein